jgi:hypothetical protein
VAVLVMLVGQEQGVQILCLDLLLLLVAVVVVRLVQTEILEDQVVVLE